MSRALFTTYLSGGADKRHVCSNPRLQRGGPTGYEHFCRNEERVKRVALEGQHEIERIVNLQATLQTVSWKVKYAEEGSDFE